MCGELQYIDFTQGIHDSKPGWTPQPPIPDEAIAKAADDPVEWDGSNPPPVGARFVMDTVFGGPLYGEIGIGPDSRGRYVLLMDDGRFMLRTSDSFRPISERDKAVAELAEFLSESANISQTARAERLYDAGYRKTENNNE